MSVESVQNGLMNGVKTLNAINMYVKNVDVILKK